MGNVESLTTHLPTLYGQSHGESYSQVTYAPLSVMRPDRERDWLEFWIEWGTTASSRLLEITLWQAAYWQEEALALQMLLQWYGQNEDYLFGVEWIAENIFVFASTAPDLLGNCFDFCSTIPDPMTVNQAVLLAFLTRDIDAWNQNDKIAIREALKNEKTAGRYEFVHEW